MKTFSISSITENSVTVREVNPLGPEPDEDNFDLYELPICFDPIEEQKELYKRSMRIKKEWEEAESKLKEYELTLGKGKLMGGILNVPNIKIPIKGENYIIGQLIEGEIVVEDGKSKVKVI